MREAGTIKSSPPKIIAAHRLELFTELKRELKG
jgi:hypothetical protein